MAKRENIGECESCRRKEKRLTLWKGKQFCSTCVNLASAVSNNREVVDRLYAQIHGAVLVAGENCETGGPELDYLHEVVDQVSLALGGGISAGDLAGAVRDLAQRAAVMTSAVQVAEDHGTECDPNKCDELRDALNALLAVQREFARGGLTVPDGAPRADAIEMQARAMVNEALELNALVEDLRIQLADRPEIAPADQYIVPAGYEKLFNVYANAMHQAANGKGLERHATPVPFEQQSSCGIARDVGLGFPIGQAIKKAKECQRLGGQAVLVEILGAINYLGMAYIVKNEDLPAADA